MVVFEFEKQIFNQMLLFVCISGMFYIDTARNNRDYTSIFYPASKFIVVITLSAKISLSFSPNGPSRGCAIQISLRFLLESKNVANSQVRLSPHGPLLSNLPPCFVRLLCGISFLTSLVYYCNFYISTLFWISYQELWYFITTLFSRWMTCGKPQPSTA